MAHPILEGPSTSEDRKRTWTKLQQNKWRYERETYRIAGDVAADYKIPRSVADELLEGSPRVQVDVFVQAKEGLIWRL